MSLDHGILNVPLRKRGNMDRDIDRYKAEQRKQLNDAVRARNALRRQAQAAAKQFSANLKDLAWRAPEHAIAMMERVTGRCAWKPAEHAWETGCGRMWEFTFDGPVENRMTYCHGCGKPVKVEQPAEGERDG